MGGRPKAKPTPVPTADPVVVQAQFVAGEEDDLSTDVKKKKAGKGSLKVARKKKVKVGVAGTGAGASGGGLAVGKK